MCLLNKVPGGRGDAKFLGQEPQPGEHTGGQGVGMGVTCPEPPGSSALSCPGPRP